MSTSGTSLQPSWPKVLCCRDVTVYIWHHIMNGYVGEIPCWTYVSHGMEKVNQAELVITLRRRPSEQEEAYSLEPLSWFKMVYAWGKEGRKIDPYHTHEAHFAHWLGSKKLETVTYGMPIEIPGFGRGVLPRNRLHGIALTSEEVQIAKLYGYTRVLGHYGLGQRWFPYCPWIDRDRNDCFTWAQTDNTIRKEIFPVIHKFRGVSARQEGDRIILDIPVGRGDEIKAKLLGLTQEEVMGFDSCLHSNADVCYYWEKGNKEMRLYGGCDGNRDCIGLAFLILCPQQAKDYYSIVEDGMAIHLRDRTWLSIRDALINQSDIEVPLIANNGYKAATLSLEYRRKTYSYPPTGLVLTLSNGYTRSWHSRKPGWLRKSHMRLDRIAVTDGFGHDATALPSVTNLMEQVGEGIAAVIPKKGRGAGTKLIGVTIALPAADAESCFNLNISPDMDDVDGRKIWDVFRGLELPNVGENMTVSMWFGLWE